MSVPNLARQGAGGSLSLGQVVHAAAAAAVIGREVWPPWMAVGERVQLAPVQTRQRVDPVPPRVLLVEPDRQVRSLIEAGLVKEGFAVHAVSSVDEAWRELRMRRRAPAAIICESELPGTDGFTFCGELRAEHCTAHVPVLLLARQPASSRAELARSAGADDYLPMPLFVNDLVTLVRLKSGASAVDGSFEADTGELSLPQLLRALLAGMRSGWVEMSDRRGQLAFHQGKVVGATFAGNLGPAALSRMLLLGRGTYVVRLGLVPSSADFHYGLEELCAEGLPRFQRWQGLARRAVPLEARLTVDFRLLAQAQPELPDGIAPLFHLFDGRRTVEDVVLASSLDELITLEAVTLLYCQGVLSPRVGPSRASPALQALPAPLRG